MSSNFSFCRPQMKQRVCSVTREGERGEKEERGGGRVERREGGRIEGRETR